MIEELIIFRRQGQTGIVLQATSSQVSTQLLLFKNTEVQGNVSVCHTCEITILMGVVSGSHQVKTDWFCDTNV